MHFQQGLVKTDSLEVCACERIFTQPLCLTDKLSRAFHKQLVQRLLGRFVRFGCRSATHRPVTENVTQLTFCPRKLT